MAQAPAYTYTNTEGVYYFQLRLPKDLQALPLEQRGNLPTIIRKSLGTHSRAEAAAKAGALLSEYTATFERIRKDLSTGAQDARTQKGTLPAQMALLNSLTLLEAKALASKYRLYIEDMVPDAGETCIVVQGSRDHAGYEDARDLQLEVVTDHQEECFISFLRDTGIWIGDDHSYKLAKALAAQTVQQMAREDAATALVAQEEAKEAPTPTSKQRPLQSLLAALINAKTPTPTRQGVYKAAVDGYERYLKRPAMLPDDFDKETLAGYKAFRLGKGMKISTWNSQHAAIMNMLIGIAFEESIIAKPFKISVTADEEKGIRKQQGLPLHDRSEEGRRAATDAEIEQMRKLPIIKAHAEFFEFLLATGMRSAEAAQLKPCDVLGDTSGDHGLFVRVTDTEGRSVKNQSSVRTVPVPRGPLTEFFRKQMERGYPFIFDDLEKGRPTKGRGVVHRSAKTDADRTQTPARRIEWLRKEFSEAKRKASIDSRVTMHSLRHTWKLKARIAGIQDSVNDYLTGHSSKSNKVAMMYGQGYDTAFKVLREASDAVIAVLP
ncbi:DUF6538 domain-containing protein [Chromobacterium haemolyticum]|uniref:DUF6538 domain-containing protein n=1 Tax=Chromobacterium haemolyticum TaxID=394935 RepID=UPI0005B9AB20|nr:DUF6538 domain-containing protein [Chromobacterium haemolyticum]